MSLQRTARTKGIQTKVQGMPKNFLSSTSLVVIIPILLLGSAVAPAKGAVVTVGPSDCSAAAVNAAISVSSTLDGDTVQLTCTGSITWTSTVTIPSTKGITLQVKGATNTPKDA